MFARQPGGFRIFSCLASIHPSKSFIHSSALSLSFYSSLFLATFLSFFLSLSCSFSVSLFSLGLSLLFIILSLSISTSLFFQLTIFRSFSPPLPFHYLFLRMYETSHSSVQNVPCLDSLLYRLSFFVSSFFCCTCTNNSEVRMTSTKENWDS